MFILIWLFKLIVLVVLLRIAFTVLVVCAGLLIVFVIKLMEILKGED